MDHPAEAKSSDEDDIVLEDTDDDSDTDPTLDTDLKRKRSIADVFASRGRGLNKQKQGDSTTDLTIARCSNNRKPTSASTSSSSSVASIPVVKEIDEKFTKSALFDGTFYSVKSITEKKIEAECALCLPKTSIIKGPITTTSNFLKHLRTSHGEESMETYRHHKTQSKNAKAVAKIVPNPRANSQSTLKQARLTLDVNKKSKQHLQKLFETNLTAFIVDTMLPLSIIEHASFQKLITDLDVPVTVISRRTLVRRIDSSYTAMIQEIAATSFIGVTCHWIDDNLKRHSAALACRRFPGTHSFDKIAEALDEVQASFNLTTPKIMATITDNGSNFVKAFKEFGFQLSEVTEEDLDEPFEAEDENVGEDGGADADLTFANIDSKEFNLSRHLRCASHTLNLFSTTDLNNAINSNAAFKSKHEKVLRKCNLLWNKAGRPKSAEVIFSVLGHTLSYPAVTRWNSFYDSLVQILQEKDKLKELFVKLDLKDAFKEAELQYLEEYCRILRPLAETVDYLQGENNTFYGYLLPSILSLKIKFRKLRTDSNNAHLTTLIDKLHVRLLERFAYLFTMTAESSDAIIAAVLIPSVKMRWLNVLKETDFHADEDSISKLIIEAGVTTLEVMSGSPLDSRSGSKDPSPTNEMQAGDSFLDFGGDNFLRNSNTPGRDAELNPMSLLKNKLELELLKYLDDRRTTLNVFDDYKLLNQLFIKYNTSLTSSAPVERLFSFASYINAPRRHALSDENFQKLTLMKANRFKTV